MELLLLAIPAAIMLILWIQSLRSKVAELEQKNATLKVKAEIALDMEIANKIAEEQEQFELERVETDNWRNNI